MSDFADRVLAWFDRHGRHDLPWQKPRTAYRVWVSEIMLQQTQVQTTIPYFQRFVDALPGLPELARAEPDQVLALWAGLGYYARARNLHKAARTCMEHHDGELPTTLEALLALPGIGRSTAGAILAQAHGQRVAILDGNVKRVLARYHAVAGWPGGSATQKLLWAYSAQHLPDRRLADYTQAIMDLGATVCTRSRPACDRCPLAAGCTAHLQGLTTSLPTPRPARSYPTRDAVMLVLRDVEGRVLLQRRPPSGIWGGLWSLPEALDEAGARQWAARHAAGPELDRARALEPFEHDFSHFRLRALPLLIEVDAPARRIGDNDDLRWHPLRGTALPGLPAPVARFLQRLDGDDR